METIYKHLSCEERTMIQPSLEQRCTLSSVCRELKRNGWRNPALTPKKRGRPQVAGGYRAPLTQLRADERASMARCPSRLAMDGPLWGHVERRLRERHSSEQIAGILRRMNPDQPSLQVSHETIYTALYAMPRGTLRTELIACLRQARKSRRLALKKLTGRKHPHGNGPKLLNRRNSWPETKRKNGIDGSCSLSTYWLASAPFSWCWRRSASPRMVAASGRQAGLG